MSDRPDRPGTPRVTSRGEGRWPTALHYRRSLASRVTLLTTIAVGLMGTVVAVAAYATVQQATMSTLDKSLRVRAVAAAQYDAYQTLDPQDIPSVVSGASDVTIVLIDLRQGRQFPYPRESALRAERTDIEVALGRRPSALRTITVNGDRCRVVTVPGASRGTALMLSQSLSQTDALLSRLRAVTGIVGLVGIVAAALAGWAVARNGLRPVRRLTEQVEEIARTEQLDPIEVEGKDEVARLSTAFNEMLGSLSASRDRQRQLVADAGHELRTPLTSLRTNLELLSQAEGETTAGAPRLSPESRRELLSDVRAQIGELTTLIGDLVELARDEESGGVVHTVELSGIVEASLARVRRRATGLDFEVSLEPWWLTGDATALERACTNLLDNAVKWSPSGGTVAVRLTQGALVVDDEGHGIAEADLPHVFDRFYRSTESRAMPGSGLGLSIVHAVAERHGGAVTAGRAPAGGARLTFQVPGSTRDPREDDPAGAGSSVFSSS